MKECDRCGSETNNNETKIFGPHDFMSAVLCDDCDNGLTRYINGIELKE